MTIRGRDGAFPDVRWGSSDSSCARVLQRLAATRPGSATIRSLVPVDRWLLRRSGGRYTILGPFGSPVLLLTTTGARSGKLRTTPLIYLHDGAGILLAGSNFGQERHPAWSTNLLVHREATVAIGGVDFPVAATLLQGDARAAAWQQFASAAAPYRAYVLRTDRMIRVFRLARRDMA